MIIGYARVSTQDQNLDLQLDALRRAGCDRIFEEKASGALRERPELDRMLAMLRPGDKVIIWKLDRLGRSVQHLIELAERFRREGVHLSVLQDGIDTSTPAGRFFFNINASFAELERELISERTRAGQEAARRHGRNPGRPEGPSPKAQKKANAARTLKAQGHGPDEIAETLNISRATVYRYLK